MAWRVHNWIRWVRSVRRVRWFNGLMAKRVRQSKWNEFKTKNWNLSRNLVRELNVEWEPSQSTEFENPEEEPNLRIQTEHWIWVGTRTEWALKPSNRTNWRRFAVQWRFKTNTRKICMHCISRIKAVQRTCWQIFTFIQTISLAVVSGYLMLSYVMVCCRMSPYVALCCLMLPNRHDRYSRFLIQKSC